MSRHNDPIAPPRQGAAQGNAAVILQDFALAPMDSAAPAFVGPEAGWVIGIRGDRIAHVGPLRDAPAELYDQPPVSLGGRLVTPALIDCHTHLVHGGHRAGEWESRLAGATYEEVARAGGGILSSVRATRAASEEGLFDAALPRLDALLSDGVGTVEIKSGYGLDRDAELATLRAARRLGREREATVVTTFLGAHAVPPPWRGTEGGARAYLMEVALPTLRAAHEEGLADAVDAFCEGIAFTPDEVALLFDEAARLKLPVKLHAEQLSHTGGARLAAARGALSADHLEHATEDDARAMARAGTVAVLLPGAFYALRETKAPPVQALREAGARMAVATDANPGTSPLLSLRLAMNMACTLFGLTVREAWMGATAHAAAALGLADRGRVAQGLRADLAVWDADSPAQVIQWMGRGPLWRRMIGGQWC
jgi:imidazolonepropionase